MLRIALAMLGLTLATAAESRLALGHAREAGWRAGNTTEIAPKALISLAPRRGYRCDRSQRQGTRASEAARVKLETEARVAVLGEKPVASYT